MSKIIKLLAILAGISFLFFSNTRANTDNLSKFVLFAEDDIHLAKDVQSTSGDIGTNAKLSIAEDSIINGNLFADKIHLAGDTRITGNVSYNELKQAESSVILGEKISPVSLPIVQLPTLSDFEVGEQSLVINGEQTISPGNYNKIEIKENAKLTLEPGIYNLNNLELRESASLVFSDATTINIKDKFKAGEKAMVQDSNSLFSNLTINYKNTKSVTFGEQSSLIFKIIAPNADIHLAEKINFQGGIYAKEIHIAEQVNLSALPSGPPPAPVAISGAPGFQPCPHLWGGRNVIYGCNLYITTASADIIYDTSLDPDFESYRLYRAEHPEVTINDTLLVTKTEQGSPENILFHRDNTLALGKTYYYKLFVFNQNSLSSGSNEIIVKTFSQTINRVEGIPEPGDTQYPPDVAIPCQTAPQMQYRCVEPNPSYYWTCNSYFTEYGFRIDEFGQIYKYRFFQVPINNDLLNNVSNLKFYLRNFEVWTTFYSAQDKDYIVSIPDYGISVSVPQNTTRMLQTQVFTGVFNIGLEAVGFNQPEAGTFYVSP